MPGTKQMLNTGAEIPSLGFGTWQDVEAQVDAVGIVISIAPRCMCEELLRILQRSPLVNTNLI